jgi:asparagine synthase (glutamine-hydrolysing)
LDAIDLKYARTVAAYINSEHTEVIISRGDVLGALEHVVSVSEPTTSQPSARA